MQPLPVAARTLNRVYTALYLVDVGGQAGNDQVFYMHPNGLVVVCLAESHALFQLDGAAAPSVDFGELLQNEVSGKHKRGGLTLRPETVVAWVTAAGQPPFSLRACVRAKLFEVNERLGSQPELLRLAPSGAGFLAILQPFADAVGPLRERALTREAYGSALASRRATAAVG